ncbi:hypothetical protein CEE37_00945 [candidate division LCP-89 bacterium B3_LCP]|uniref:Uncharacterized protein n=1 Tax=candidate division LCP-89 bacterium B3_LCP TaxID=2012998 RepID=A0A532V4Z1_UNCL8|nr:MAG: hypothetical protein CEE37_00945 [candidate division LCP-89 bacterium B3_LCP]
MVPLTPTFRVGVGLAPTRPIADAVGSLHPTVLQYTKSKTFCQVIYFFEGFLGKAGDIGVSPLTGFWIAVGETKHVTEKKASFWRSPAHSAPTENLTLFFSESLTHTD